MKKLDTNPSTVEGNTIYKVGARVVSFDMEESNCEIDFRLFDKDTVVYYMEIWNPPLSSIENWNDETSVFQAVADYKGFTLKE